MYYIKTRTRKANKMKSYTAFTKCKVTKKHQIITSEDVSLKNFKQNLKLNGLMIVDKACKETNLFNWIIDNTNADETDWRLRKIPTNNEQYCQMRDDIYEADKKRFDAKYM